MSGSPAPTSYNKYNLYIKKTVSGFSTKDQAYLEIILSFVAVAFFGWFALQPTIKTITGLYQEIEAKKEIVSKLDQKIDSLIAADTVYNNARSQLEVLEEALPSEHQIAQYSAQVEQLAQESNITLKSFRFNSFPLDKKTKVTNKNQSAKDEKDKKTGSWKTLEFNLIATGEYDQHRKMIQSLFNLRRIVLIDKVSFRNVSDIEESGLEVTISGIVLYQ